ncbi:MAG: hypothetical protein A2293_11445 [Elusimicrobia bacterium RIFOXYB2_FULL_49_7]|nr:MAG: hypothetical protein A2293_11445 [Elusimicrobia bacterium RIFOXYB2_FULL_49_7]
MNKTSGAFFLSAGFHLLLILCFILFKGKLGAVETPMIIDFSIEKPPTLPEAEKTPEPPKRPISNMPVQKAIVNPQELFPDTAQADTLPGKSASTETEKTAPTESSQDSLARLKAAYVKANYTRIRDQVYEALTYPEAAREKGMEGSLLLSFWVHCDGRVDNIRLLESSGYKTLDEIALEAVRLSAPYPLSPKKVEIRLPVVFRLE